VASKEGGSPGRGTATIRQKSATPWWPDHLSRLRAEALGCVAKFILRRESSSSAFRYAAIWKSEATNFA
jgi:hypothetical protein